MWYVTRALSLRALISWGPVLAAMGVMFVASAQPKPDVPYGPPLSIYFSGLMPIFPGGWEVLIKKGGHVIAFGVLAFLAMRAGLVWDLPRRRAALLGIGLALGYALLDELHQSFVPGRHPSPADIGLDLLGALSFVSVAWRAYRPGP